MSTRSERPQSASLPDTLASKDVPALGKRSLKHQQAMKRLLAYAEDLRIDNRVDAQGRCLAASLELAAFAYSLGFESRLVMWRVVDDPQYHDHWAVAVQPELVLDSTHVQVDGTTDVLQILRSYPSNYMPPRMYLFSEVVPSVWHTTRSGRRYSWRFMGTLRWRIFWKEWAEARATRNWAECRVALGMLWNFATRYPLQHLQKSLESRLQQLQ